MKKINKKRAESMKELGAIMSSSFDPILSARSIEQFAPRTTDVVITPFGKCGTTWTQQIFHTLRTKGDMNFDDISRVVPWIETSGSLGLDINAEQKAYPRGFKSHLSYDRVPKGCRYINVIRNPIDAAYSSFKFMEGWYIEPGTVSADEFVLQNARKGEYHRHFVSWWPHRNDESVLYLVYEHMKQDITSTIKKIAAFIEVALDQDLLEITKKHSSFSFMTEHQDRFDDAMLREQSESRVLPKGSDSSKVRLGKVGGYDLGEEVIAALNVKWQEIVMPVTGFGSYKELIASLAHPNEGRV